MTASGSSDVSDKRRENRIIFAVVAATVAVALVAAWLATDQKQRARTRDALSRATTSSFGTAHAESYRLKLDRPVPDFELENVTGDRIGLSTLKGHVWVGAFIFTSCAGICPKMSRSMETLHDRLADLPEVRLVSFSVDPERDTRERLAEYADEHEADRERWYFLRGEQGVVQKLGAEGFLLADDGNPLNHSPKLALVDADGRIRGYYDGANDEYRREDVRKLEEDIRTLVARGGR